MRVAIQGYEGSFHALAAQKYFGHMPDLVMCESFPALFKALNTGHADKAVMAIENTIAGTILFNYSLLRNSDYVIRGETALRIEHMLMALPGQTIHDILEVRTHPVALMQCMAFFQQYPHIKLVEDIDTALMAKYIADNNKSGVAAIAGSGVASQYNLEIIQKNIEDSDQNFTRFLILDRQYNNIEEANKASICFNISHQKGSLLKVINLINELNINIMTLQTNPFTGKAWEYYFNIDITYEHVHMLDALMDKLGTCTTYYKLLGKYKQGL
ncbi:MAG: prephenate dehydratase domain-containing protein [Cytophagales bacterium]|nr:prephenate dehydratase domain-containing protein [Cytophagales bacterium]